jgi:hypothetical protein
MLTGHYLARYVKMRELMLDRAGREWNPGRDASVTIRADKDLPLPSRLSYARRDGWKCKDRARLCGGLESRVESLQSRAYGLFR